MSRCNTQAFTLTALALLSLPIQASADSRSWCGDGIQTGWHFYCDPELVEEEPAIEEEIKPAMAPPPENAPEEEPQTAQERLAVFSAQVEEAKALAILEPTEEHLIAYLRIQKEMLDRAENFQKVWQRALYKSPDLDHNTVYPLTNPGVFDYQDRQRLEREAKLAEISQTHVIMFVTEKPDVCYVCKTQADIVVDLIEQHNVAVFVVSKDGYRYEAFPDAEIDRGNLAGFGLGDNPTPFFVIIEPATGELHQIGHGLLTRDQILARVLEVMEPKLIEIASDQENPATEKEEE